MSTLIDVCFDFETRSRLDLKKVGTIRYATDPSTEATLLTWTFGRNGAIKAWSKGQAIPPELIHMAENPHVYRFIAWNIQFDFLIWTCVFSRLIPSMVRPKIENIEDAMAVSCHFRTGASLDACAKFMNLPYTKDKEGRRLMLKQCKPNSKGQWVDLTSEEQIAFERYGIMDTRILRDAYYNLPPLPSSERWCWEWTFKRNLRGIRVDVDLINEMDSIIEESMPKLVDEFAMLVGFKTSMNSPIKCRDFFAQYYPTIENMRADTVRDMMEATHFVPPNVKRALEIKDLAGSTSIAKVATAKNLMYNGRIYELLAYHYAQTKRWAGRGIQMQNFPRVDNSLQDKIDFDLDVKDLTSTVKALRPNLKDPIGFVKNLLRRIWLPTDGKTFYCGDFSKVEPSVLFWLTGMGTIPKKWYEEMAAEIYRKDVALIGKDSEERQIGKMANLSCQYQTGAAKFQASVKKDTGIILSDVMAKQVVDAYRRKNAPVVALWNDLNLSFRKAIYGTPSVLCNGKVHVMPMQYPWKGVQIRLPSGSYLYYHGAKEITEEVEEEVTELRNGQPYKFKVKKTKTVMKYLSDQGGGNIAYDYVYGGLLCIGEGTLVLTKRGWIKIEKVLNTDVLWDGVEWVSCDGHVYNGKKETIESHGAWFTPDHLILTEKGWENASQGKGHKRAACRLPDGHKIPWIERYKVFVGNTMRLWNREDNGSNRVHKDNEEERQSFLRLSIQTVFKLRPNYTWNVKASRLCSLEINEDKVFAAISSSMEELWRERDQSMRKVARIIREFLGGYGPSISERSDPRQDKQRRGILKRKLQMDDIHSASKQQTKLKKVYDIINCGPRNRFVVLAGGRPLIVHNCENVVSATSRDIMLPAMWRLENAGFEVLGCVHDELWGEADPGREEEFTKLMCVNPSWCEMEITADLKAGQRYLK